MLQPTEQTEQEHSAPELQVDSFPFDLAKQQCKDSTLAHCFKEAEKDLTPLSEQFHIENDLLHRQSDGRQQVLPMSCRKEVFRIGHYAPVPLVPRPVISTPFECIGVDIMGPVERSQAENRFILVISDYATRYPLREVTAKQVASALLKIFSQIGIPREVLTD